MIIKDKRQKLKDKREEKEYYKSAENNARSKKETRVITIPGI
jgi:hypothetical protein